VKVSIIIPAFEEETTLARVLGEVLEREIPDGELEVVVSDDGSRDETARIAEETAAQDRRLRVVRATENRGKSEAIRQALPFCSGEIVVIHDADHEYSARDIPSLAGPFRDPGVQAVYGSRFLATARPAGMKPHYRWANRLFTSMANLLFGGSLTDEGTALKAVRRELLMSLDLRSQRFGFCPEVTAKLLKRGIHIVEIPVSYRARSRREGKKPGVRDGLEILWTLVRERFSLARGR
jgi:dolichol-phosphate mannosyltransferase